MLTRVKGKVILNKYRVESNLKKIKKDNKSELVYTARPTLIKESNVIDWQDICKFNGEPYYNKECFTVFGKSAINISEDETVYINREVFRADLNELHVFTDKIVEESDVCKEKFEAKFKQELANFNEQMIESNDRLLSYCKLHKLNQRETDAIELFKLIYGHSNYQITDGVMKETYINYYNAGDAAIDALSTAKCYTDSITATGTLSASTATLSHTHTIY